jgi:hypothetical protein
MTFNCAASLAFPNQGLLCVETPLSRHNQSSITQTLWIALALRSQLENAFR